MEGIRLEWSNGFRLIEGNFDRVFLLKVRGECIRKGKSVYLVSCPHHYFYHHPYEYTYHINYYLNPNFIKI